MNARVAGDLVCVWGTRNKAHIKVTTASVLVWDKASKLTIGAPSCKWNVVEPSLKLQKHNQRVEA